MVQNTEENRDRCICPKCPTYPKCGSEILYCSIGKSLCDINASGCICNICPIYKEYDLKTLYFCDKDFVGKEKINMRKIHSYESDSNYSSILEIKNKAKTAKSFQVAMGSQKKLPYSLNDFHFVPAQIWKIPLNKEEKVATEIKIGPNSKRPMVLSSPILISGMSFGATSRKVKIIISQVAKKLKIGFNSGEGGILEEEFNAKEFLIGQYATGRFGIDKEILNKVAAVEIRFGQGAYPGKGSFLPSSKVTSEIAKIRGLKGGEAANSPASHFDMKTPNEIKNKVEYLRKLANGVPIGAKIGCGNIEKDIKVLISSGIDFIALDGFGGGTGATDQYFRDNVGIPIWAALPRARKFLDDQKIENRISLIASGGLRTSSDIAKCLCLGADAVYIGTAALIAIGCEQYRICNTGLCPKGITTQNPELQKQLDLKIGLQNLMNFVNITNEEISNVVRAMGKNDIKNLTKDDLVSLHKDLAIISGVKYLDGKNY